MISYLDQAAAASYSRHRLMDMMWTSSRFLSHEIKKPILEEAVDLIPCKSRQGYSQGLLDEALGIALALRPHSCRVDQFRQEAHEVDRCGFRLRYARLFRQRRGTEPWRLDDFQLQRWRSHVPVDRPDAVLESAASDQFSKFAIQEFAMRDDRPDASDRISKGKHLPLPTFLQDGRYYVRAATRSHMPSPQAHPRRYLHACINFC